MSALAIIVFALSVGVVIYILAGYPIYLALAARLFAKAVRKQTSYKTVTVLMAVNNGEAWIEAKLRSILALRYPRELLEILVISDGSTDRTEEVVRTFAGEGVELYCLPKGGKAAALNAGMAQARGEILFFTDVRQPLDPDCLAHLVGCMADPRVGGATGQIVFRRGDDGQAHVGLYWRYEKWIRDNLTRLDSSLVATGAIYAIRRELARPLPTGTLIDDAFLPLSCILRGYRFVFERNAVAYDFPTALETEFYRKVRTLAGLYQLVWTSPTVLGPANRLWFHFLSYKVGRLMLPHAMILAAFSSLWLPESWGLAAVAMQAVFYAAAALDPLVPRGPWKRLSSFSRTFVVLMAASFCAVSVFFVPAGRLWKETKVQPASHS